MLSGLSWIDSVSLSRGSLQEEEWPRLTTGAGIASGLDIWLDEKPAQSLAYIMRRAREWKYKHGIRALFLDYLQLVQTAEGRETRSEKLGAITKGLRALAKELQIAVRHEACRWNEWKTPQPIQVGSESLGRSAR